MTRPSLVPGCYDELTLCLLPGVTTLDDSAIDYTPHGDGVNRNEQRGTQIVIGHVKKSLVVPRRLSWPWKEREYPWRTRRTMDPRDRTTLVTEMSLLHGWEGPPK